MSVVLSVLGFVKYWHSEGEFIAALEKKIENNGDLMEDIKDVELDLCGGKYLKCPIFENQANDYPVVQMKIQGSLNRREIKSRGLDLCQVRFLIYPIPTRLYTR